MSADSSRAGNPTHPRTAANAKFGAVYGRSTHSRPEKEWLGNACVLAHISKCSAHTNARKRNAFHTAIGTGV
jgi:hypothetical protein